MKFISNFFSKYNNKRKESERRNRIRSLEREYSVAETTDKILITHNNIVIAEFERTAHVSDVLDKLDVFRKLAVDYDENIVRI